MHPESTSVVGLGELLWDVFPDGKRPGGAPANVAFQAQQLGCQGVVASRVGADAEGEELIRFLKTKGLDTSAIQGDSQHPTGRVTVEVTGPGQHEFMIHEGVAWDHLKWNPDLQKVMKSAAAVCFGTLAQRSAGSRESIQSAVQATPAECLRVYDVNLRQHYYDRDWIADSLKLANVVKLNDSEVTALAPLLDLSPMQADFARELLTGWELDLVCITRGEQGALITDQSSTYEIPGRKVDVVDTVGAGDAFTAGLIVSRIQGWPWKRCGMFANRVGGLVASRSGAMPELKREFQSLKAEFLT